MLSPRILLMIAVVWTHKTVSLGSEKIDICNLTRAPMFCNCEPASRNETAITCFILDRFESDDELWSSFDQTNEHVVALTLTKYTGPLEYLPVTAFQQLPFLQTITVKEGTLGSVESGSVSNMSHLVTLLLERNEISQLQPYAIAHLPKLKKLILSENYLSEILADCLVDLMDLEMLYLDRNNVSRIEACAFCSMHNLKELELWGNVLTDLTESMFRGLRYLTRIDLYRNQLRVISSKVFKAMPRLKEIDLRENLIEYISPRAFEGLPMLMMLKLNENRIKCLSEEVFKYPTKLMTVDISSNLLETLHEDLVKNLANVEDKFFTFSFRANPLRCGCDLQWISRYLTKVKSTVLSRELRNAECKTAEGNSETAHQLILTDCETTTESTTSTPLRSTTTFEFGSNVTKVPEIAHDEEVDDDNNSASKKTIDYLGLCLYTAIMSSLIMYKRDV